MSFFKWKKKSVKRGVRRSRPLIAPPIKLVDARKPIRLVDARKPIRMAGYVPSRQPFIAPPKQREMSYRQSFIAPPRQEQRVRQPLIAPSPQRQQVAVQRQQPQLSSEEVRRRQTETLQKGYGFAKGIYSGAREQYRKFRQPKLENVQQVEWETPEEAHELLEQQEIERDAPRMKYIKYS